MQVRTIGIALVLVAACATNPVTGRSELALVSEAQEIEMGKQYAEEVKASIGLVDDPALQAYVSRIGMEMARASERPDIPWQFHVVDDPAINAFALPGGPVFITRGILTHMNSEAEMASVLGHEIGHITARHSVQQMSRAQLANVGLGLGSILSPTVAQFGGLLSTGLSILFLQYGRDAEAQSDQLGFKYMLAQSYDPREMADMFVTLQRTSPGGSALPTWLSSHPDPGNREVVAKARADSLSRDLDALEVNRDEFLRQTDDLVFGTNPREGFFRENLFLHPDLRFQIRFPEGWQGQNTKQAVLAQSPNQDAIIQLTAGSGSPQAAAQQFFNAQGISETQVGNTTINGLPAVSGYFQAQTQQGTIQGLAVFVSHGDLTYQLLGYTPAERMRGYDATFRSSFGSFGRLTDQSALNVQPARVSLVRVPSRMSLASFNQRYPSSISLEALAIMNGVETTATIAAGTTLKRVR
ncbi:MAG TPA: M48 family metalloprotease [Gemmatimonadales bacterium]|nr:M48 family metalloprotease [Gemmatimonadales bacterium]